MKPTVIALDELQGFKIALFDKDDNKLYVSKAINNLMQNPDDYEMIKDKIEVLIKPKDIEFTVWFNKEIKDNEKFKNKV